jgi:hypothetical protein
MADEITTTDMLREVDRELQQRNRVYKRLVEQGKLTQQKSDRQIALMRAVRDVLAERVAGERLI